MLNSWENASHQGLGDNNLAKWLWAWIKTGSHRGGRDLGCPVHSSDNSSFSEPSAALAPEAEIQDLSIYTWFSGRAECWDSSAWYKSVPALGHRKGYICVMLNFWRGILPWQSRAWLLEPDCLPWSQLCHPFPVGPGSSNGRVSCSLPQFTMGLHNGTLAYRVIWEINCARSYDSPGRTAGTKDVL